MPNWINGSSTDKYKMIPAHGSFRETSTYRSFWEVPLCLCLLLAVGWQLGILNDESPDWTWISAVLLIDVAHVWSTSFRVYFDTEEFKRRFWLYLLVPVFGYAVGVALYSAKAN